MSQPLVFSSADSLSGDLEVGSSQTSFGPIGLAAGAAPPAFDSTQTVDAFNQTYNLDHADPNLLTLQVQATKLVNNASSAGLGTDNISAQATANIQSPGFLLTDNPLSTLSFLGLSASATFINSNSDASYVYGPNRGSLSGDASFGSLTISGALVGGETLSFSGDAAANTILYKSPTVTITLDKQTLSDLLPTSGPAPVSPSRITTDALDIQLKNAPLSGNMISGDIVLGETTASLLPPLHV